MNPIAHWYIVLFLIFPAVTQAQELAKQSLPPAAQEIKAEIDRLYAAIQKLEEDLGVAELEKEQRQIWEEMRRMDVANSEAQRPLDDKLEKIRSNPAWKKFETVAQPLREKLRGLTRLDYRDAYDEGHKQARARHAELTKIAAPETPQLHALGFDLLSFPRVDGSTSTQPLAALIACRAFRAEHAWVGKDQWLKYRDPIDAWLSYTPEPDFERGSPEAKLTEYKIEVTGEAPQTRRLSAIVNTLLANNASTPTAYKNVINGTSDLGLLARPPTPAELDQAKQAGVELDVTPCAYDAFVLIAHRTNPATGLTTAQIRQIYTAADPIWPGNKSKLTAYQREEGSGSQELMQSLVMKDLQLYKPKPPRYAPQLYDSVMSTVFLQLTGHPEGLAYSVWYYEQFMIGSARTKMLAVDGVLPSYETIQQGKYPYATPVMLVTRKGLPADAPARKLRNWLLSAEGQAVVKQSGYVPVK